MRLRRLALLVGSLSGAGALTFGCALTVADQEVEVEVPPPPAHWQVAFPGLCVAVASRDSSGSRTRTIVDWRSRATIRCARAVNVPVLAYPFVPGEAALEEGRLRPAGGFFPLSVRRRGARNVVELSWEDGAVALVMDRVGQAGRDVSRFNVERLCAYLRKAEDPWSLDLDAVAQKIAQESFTAWDVDPLPAWDVRVAPGAGTWFLESPFFAPVAAENGSLFLPGVPRGSHRVYSLCGERWTLEVEEDGPVLSR